MSDKRKPSGSKLWKRKNKQIAKISEFFRKKQ